MEGEDMEVVVINKDEVIDMVRQLMEQISVIRDKIEEIEGRLGEHISTTTGEESEEEVVDEEKGVAPEGEGGSKKEREKMDVSDQINAPKDTGEVKAEGDVIKADEIREIIREEIKKAFGDVVSTPHPDVDTVEVRKEEDDIVKGIRAILEGKMRANDFKKMVIGGGE